MCIVFFFKPLLLRGCLVNVDPMENAIGMGGTIFLRWGCFIFMSVIILRIRLMFEDRNLTFVEYQMKSPFVMNIHVFLSFAIILLWEKTTFMMFESCEVVMNIHVFHIYLWSNITYDSFIHLLGKKEEENLFRAYLCV